MHRKNHEENANLKIIKKSNYKIPLTKVIKNIFPFSSKKEEEHIIIELPRKKYVISLKRFQGMDILRINIRNCLTTKAFKNEKKKTQFEKQKLRKFFPSLFLLFYSCHFFSACFLSYC